MFILYINDTCCSICIHLHTHYLHNHFFSQSIVFLTSIHFHCIHAASVSRWKITPRYDLCALYMFFLDISFPFNFISIVLFIRITVIFSKNSVLKIKALQYVFHKHISYNCFNMQLFMCGYWSFLETMCYKSSNITCEKSGHAPR